MIDMLLDFLACACLAVPITVVLGAIYFAFSISLIDKFRLNYGAKPIGFTILNWTLGLTIFSYFVVFAVLFRRC